MQQLNGLDASFLALETPTMFAQVAHLVIFDADGLDTATFEQLCTLVEERIHVFPAFRRRIVAVPLELDHPYWIEDPHFDIEYHLRQSALPSPGTDSQLAELVARIMSRPLDRGRPLWEMYHIEGLQGGRVAWLNKIHHCAMDGLAGAGLLTDLLDDSAETTKVTQPQTSWKPDHLPGSPEMLVRAALGLAINPVNGLRLTARVLRTLGVVGRSGKLPFGWGRLPWAAVRTDNPDARRTPGPPLIAPRVSFNGIITPHRRYVFGSLSLSKVKALKRHYGSTVNDVVLALCTSALRSYLDKRGELPAKPLVAFVPVAVFNHDASHKSSAGNRISGLWAPLPVHVADPVERLRLISGAMRAARDVHHAIGADLLQDITQFATPAISARAARLAFRTRMARHGRPIYNLVISNVPGPSHPLYLAGAEMQHWYPVSLINDAAGLNITVHSYRDYLDFGLIACRELVPELDSIMDGLAAGLFELTATMDNSLEQDPTKL